MMKQLRYDNNEHYNKACNKDKKGGKKQQQMKLYTNTLQGSFSPYLICLTEHIQGTNLCIHFLLFFFIAVSLIYCGSGGGKNSSKYACAILQNVQKRILKKEKVAKRKIKN